MDKTQILSDIVFFLLGFLFIILLFFLKIDIKNLLVYIGIPFLFFLINFFLIHLTEQEFTENYPFKNKKKRSSLEKFNLGMIAGFHYLFFIGTYSHKKYNTQVFYPETTECYWGNVSQLLILVLYIALAIWFYLLVGAYYILFLIIPIVTNIISLLTPKR